MSKHDPDLDSRLGIAYLAAEGNGDVVAALQERHEREWGVADE